MLVLCFLVWENYFYTFLAQFKHDMPYFLSDFDTSVTHFYLSHFSYLSHALSHCFLLFLCDLLLQYKLCLFLSPVTCLCLSQLPLTVMPGSLSHVSVGSCKASVPLLCSVIFFIQCWSVIFWNCHVVFYSVLYLYWSGQISSIMYLALFTLTDDWRRQYIARHIYIIKFGIKYLNFVDSWTHKHLDFQTHATSCC